MSNRLPPSAVVLGVLGLIPFVALGISAQAAGEDAESQRYLLALLGYGAVVLAFLGGVHWGFVLSPTALAEGASEPPRRDAFRLAMGVLPSLIGWAALLTALLGVPEVGLVVLIAGFVVTVAAESRLRQRGQMPAGAMALRWGLSVVVLMVLVAVLALRLIGARILL